MKTLCIISALLLSLTVSAREPEKAIKPWTVVEVAFTSSSFSGNPYTEFLRENEKPHLTAEFRCISGEDAGKTMTIPGFWDGGNSWKIRFAPPAAGTWTYETRSSDRKMSGKKGKFNVSAWTEEEKTENPLRRGFIIVNKSGERKGRYFTYSDGTPVIWIADTWWNWSNGAIKPESYMKLADTRSAQGFNIGQLFFAANGWGEESSLLSGDSQKPKLEQIRNVEGMIRYANSKGITVWIHPWWTRENIDESIGAENIRRWWRYVIHRLHAYNVIWVLAGEYNMNNYGGFPLSFWNSTGELIKAEDPYDRIKGAHPTPPMWEGGAEAPQWSTAEAIHNENWVDYNQTQSGHARWCNELLPAIISAAYKKQPAKPIVCTEPWYEFIEGNPTAMDVRFAAWSAVMSGAAGHTYGGGHTWKGHLPENPMGADSWPMDQDFTTNTMIYPGAVSVGFMGKYLSAIKWYRLEPHPGLVIDNPSQYCLSIPGQEYLFFLRYGGSVKIDLSSYPSSEYSFAWTDLVNSKESDTGSVKGGSVTEIKCPEDYPGTVNFKDWVLYVRKK